MHGRVVVVGSDSGSEVRMVRPVRALVDGEVRMEVAVAGWCRWTLRD